MKKTGGTAAGLAVVLALLLVLLPGQAQYQARASSSDTTSRAALAGMSVLDRLVHAPGGFFSLVSATGDNSTVTEPDISVSPAAIDFGTVVVGTSSPAQTVTITNSGTANLTIGTANISGDSAAEFHIESDNASQQTLAPSVNATIQIVFSPVSGGTKSATLSIPSNDPDQPTASVSLSGVGAIPPAPPPAPSPPPAPPPPPPPYPAPPPGPGYGSISGQVYLGAAPFSGAFVSAYSEDAGYKSYAFSQTGGSYTITGLPSGSYRVYANTGSYATVYYSQVYTSQQATPVLVASPFTTTGINFNLESNGSITGRVYQSDNVTPVEGATVYAVRVGQGYSKQANTDAGGSYTIDALPPGDYWVYADAPGYIREYYPSTHIYYQSGAVSVNATGQTAGIDFSLDVGGTISGYVFQSDNVTPVAGAGVFIISSPWIPSAPAPGTPPPPSPPPSPPMPKTTSAADGSYTLAGLSSANYQLAADAAGYVMEFYAATVTAPGETGGINFSLDAGGGILGRVYQADNITPIPRASVYVYQVSGGYVLGAATGSDGSYIISDIPSGEYWVRARSYQGSYLTEYYGGVADYRESVPVMVNAPAVTGNIDFNLDAGGTISGHVYESDNATPIAGASVHIFPLQSPPPPPGLVPEPVQVLSTFTATDGSYAISGLVGGSYRVSAFAAGRYQEYYDDTTVQQQAAPVTVAAANQTSGINFSLAAAWADVIVDAPLNVFPYSAFPANLRVLWIDNLDAASYTVSVDPSVLRLENVTSGNIGGTEIPVSFWNESPAGSGNYYVVQNVPGLSGASGAGMLAELQFKVLGSLGATTRITISDGVLSSNQAQEIQSVWTGRQVDVSLLPGDANGDGKVNAIDITKVERVIVKLDPATPGADANQDGKVNAIDITKVERIIAGLDPGLLLTLRYMTSASAASPMSQADAWFFNKVAGLSGGLVRMEYYYGQSASSLLASVSAGDADIGTVPVSILPLSKGLAQHYLTVEPDTLALAAAYLYDTFTPLKEEWEASNNVKVLYFLAADAALLTGGPVPGVADIAGLKIGSSWPGTDTLQRLNAVPVAVPYTETFPALELGVINGVITPFSSINSLRLFEPAKYLTETWAGPSGLSATIINKNVWDSLPVLVKGAMETLSGEAGLAYLYYLKKANEEAVQEMMASGVDFHLWSAADRDAAKGLVQPAQANKWIEQTGDNALQLHQALLEALALLEPYGSAYKSGFEIREEAVLQGPPRILHPLERSDCLACHAAGGVSPFPPDHTGRSNDTCLACHQP